MCRHCTITPAAVRQPPAALGRALPWHPSAGPPRAACSTCCCSSPPAACPWRPSPAASPSASPTRPPARPPTPTCRPCRPGRLPRRRPVLRRPVLAAPPLGRGHRPALLPVLRRPGTPGRRRRAEEARHQLLLRLRHRRPGPPAPPLHRRPAARDRGEARPTPSSRRCWRRCARRAAGPRRGARQRLRLGRTRAAAARPRAWPTPSRCGARGARPTRATRWCAGGAVLTLSWRGGPEVAAAGGNPGGRRRGAAGGGDKRGAGVRRLGARARPRRRCGGGRGGRGGSTGSGSASRRATGR